MAEAAETANIDRSVVVEQRMTVAELVDMVDTGLLPALTDWYSFEEVAVVHIPAEVVHTDMSVVAWFASSSVAVGGYWAGAKQNTSSASVDEAAAAAAPAAGIYSEAERKPARTAVVAAGWDVAAVDNN